jgi:hypothetical protein
LRMALKNRCGPRGPSGDRCPLGSGAAKPDAYGYAFAGVLSLSKSNDRSRSRRGKHRPRNPLWRRIA